MLFSREDAELFFKLHCAWMQLVMAPAPEILNQVSSASRLNFFPLTNEV